MCFYGTSSVYRNRRLHPGGSALKGEENQVVKCQLLASTHDQVGLYPHESRVIPLNDTWSPLISTISTPVMRRTLASRRDLWGWVCAA